MHSSFGDRFSSKLNSPVKFLVFFASLREPSLNKQLAELAAKIIGENGGEADLAAMADFESPSYNQNVHDNSGFPPGAEKMCSRIKANDALVIASPEYNGSMPGVLKNVIDWVSRYLPQPFNERHVLLLSASPSMLGGNRGLWALRIPLEHLGARVFPDMFSLAQAHTAFDSSGKIINEQLSKRFDATIRSFMELTEAAKNYPCAKKAWFEYLGEPINDETARAE